MARLLIVRHGQSEYNRRSLWQGHADPPLTDYGRQQAAQLARDLGDLPLDAAYSSDLRRAYNTALAIAEPRGLSVTPSERLREIDVGEWSGLTTDEIEARDPEGLARYRDGGEGWSEGETHAEMSARITGEAEAIAAAHPDETVLVVVHGGTIRALLARAEGIDLSEYRRTRTGPATASVSQIAIEDGRWRRID